MSPAEAPIRSQGPAPPPVLYAALPVHLVGNWSLFDAAQLNASWAALRRRTFNAARLYIDWWLTFILRTCLETP